MSLPDTKADQERRLRLDLKRRLRLAGFESDLAAINDITALRQLLVQQVPYSLNQQVEVQFSDGWRLGRVTGFGRIGSEEFDRIAVSFGDDDSTPLPPERVRPAETVGPFPQEFVRGDRVVVARGLSETEKTLVGRVFIFTRYASGYAVVSDHAGSWHVHPESLDRAQEPAPGSPEAVTQAAEMIRHTPGPWVADGFTVKTAREGLFIAIHSEPQGSRALRAECEANAQIAAAAPDLADALAALRDEIKTAAALPVAERSAWTNTQHFRRMAVLLLTADAALRKAGRS